MQCHSGQQPWDERLRLSKHRVSPATSEAISLAGLLTRFGRAAKQTLKKLTRIAVSESTVQRVTEDAGGSSTNSRKIGGSGCWKGKLP